MKRWWQASHGIRFVLILLGAILLWVLVISVVRS